MKEPLLPCPFDLDGINHSPLMGVIEYPAGFAVTCRCGMNGPIRKTPEAAEERWNDRHQSPPVAQVEVYRKALEMISHHEDCLCKPGMEVVKEALLTSKPEPVAPVRKWKAEDVVGYFSFTKDGFRHQVLYETLSPEVQDALRGKVK